MERSDLRGVRDAETGSDTEPDDGLRVLVHLTWLDAHSGEPTGWVHPEDLYPTPYLVHTVGYLLPLGHGGKHGHTSVCQSIGDDGAVDHVLHIPTGMVQTCHTLKEYL